MNNGVWRHADTYALTPPRPVVPAASHGSPREARHGGAMKIQQGEGGGSGTPGNFATGRNRRFFLPRMLNAAGCSAVAGD